MRLKYLSAYTNTAPNNARLILSNILLFVNFFYILLANMERLPEFTSYVPVSRVFSTVEPS